MYTLATDRGTFMCDDVWGLVRFLHYFKPSEAELDGHDLPEGVEWDISTAHEVIGEILMVLEDRRSRAISRGKQ